MPEVGGPIDPDNEAHDLVMSVFGGMSKGERNRIKVRVRTAMASQTELEGRYLGGRPPYGYTLHDLGPHPNPAKAADGRRLRGLAPEPSTAPIVRRIFADYIAGNGIFAIAEALTNDNIPCPSAADPKRNSHRSGIAWSKSAVRTILTNPRYTGRQVWNKQRTDEVLVDVRDVSLGYTNIMRWNPTNQRITSKELSHEPLVSDETFAQAQSLMHRRATHSTPHLKHRTRHPYIFRGRVHCDVCQRRMQGQHSHGVAYYRCRYAKEYAIANKVDHPINVFLREDIVVGPIDAWLASAFSPTNLDHTITMLTNSQPTDHSDLLREQARKRIAECETKLNRYRATLDAGADPTVVTAWITDTETERRLAEAELATITDKPARLTRDDITALIKRLGDIRSALANADPNDKAEVYRQLNLRLNYQPEDEAVHAMIDLGAHRGDLVCVRRGT
ncbi:recombinase family protein [Actinoplanes sp. LDG1-06]|uniref:Recombinase family protein n=1 Tax=Paractinoplanes ovalisporus TaxID=2810368 RepID=A0ABS2AKW2_9ACTN|nr:recombinase family protein [Actinoplanes ovalisporus]MBM2620475.1 recombinase family protein [Actinoplanes ovalisporus]